MLSFYGIFELFVIADLYIFAWTFLSIATLGNTCRSITLLSAMSSCDVWFSYVSLGTTSTWLWTFSNIPWAPDAVNYYSRMIFISFIKVYQKIYWFFYFLIWLSRLKPGHGSGLHSSIAEGCPSQVPPFASSTSFVRLFILVPVPQVLEHSPRIQSSHSQWIAKYIIWKS